MGSKIKKPIEQRRAWFRACTSRSFKGNVVSESDMIWQKAKKGWSWEASINTSFYTPTPFRSSGTEVDTALEEKVG